MPYQTKTGIIVATGSTRVVHGGRGDYRKHQDREFKRLYAFLYTKDYGKAAVAFKQAMQEAHPDHGGNPEQASRIIVAWDEYKKRNGWSGPAPKITPVAAPKRKPCIFKTDERYLADVKAGEKEFNARREKEMEAATDRCAHSVRNDDIEQDCVICFSVHD